MGAGKNVGNRLYINFGTASRFGLLLEALRKSGTVSELEVPLANLIRDTARAVVEALGLARPHEYVGDYFYT